MEIANGWQQMTEPHPTPLPIDASATPGVVAPTPVTGQLSGPTCPAADTVGMFASQAAAGTADAAAAMSSGMAADGARRQFYEADIKPIAAEYGITMVLPDVPAFMVPPTDSYDYVGTGDEPVLNG